MLYKNLPFVMFEYPNSETNYMELRFVRVIVVDDTYLRGYEFANNHPSATDKGKFKTYLLAKIVTRGIHLFQFSLEEETGIGV